MLSHLKKYPLSICIIAVIIYLSFFTPPKTDMGDIPGLDKLVHTCMYGGLCLVIWFEYLRSHRSINFIKVDFREDQLFFDTHGIVTSSIERIALTSPFSAGQEIPSHGLSRKTCSRVSCLIIFLKRE